MTSGGGPIQIKAGGLHGAREGGVLGEEAVPRMDRLRPGLCAPRRGPSPGRGTTHAPAAGRCGRPSRPRGRAAATRSTSEKIADALVAELAARPDEPHRDLAAIRDEDPHSPTHPVERRASSAERSASPSEPFATLARRTDNIRATWSASSRSVAETSSEARPMSRPSIKSSSTSAIEPSAMLRKRAYSRLDSRFEPSAMLAATDTAARRSCAVSLNRSSDGKLAVIP